MVINGARLIMPKFTLIAEYSDPSHKMTHEFNADYLPEVIENMDLFLRGVGFYYDGQLNIEQEEEYVAPAPLQNMEFPSFGTASTKSSYYYDTERNK